jgi:AcrR family transcriptional regulator
MPTPSKREVIVTTALRLFSEQGFHATGIDQVVSESGVSKKTLYSHFRSKDELILAVLAYYDGAFRNDFMKRVEAAAKRPRARLLAVYDVAGRWFEDEKFFGCLFVNAVGEHSKPESPLRHVCQGFKKQMRDYIRELVEDAGLDRPAEISAEFALLLEGAIVTAQVSDTVEAAKTAKRIAKKLLAGAG